MRVLIAGGRDFADRELLFETLDRLHAERRITVVIHGAARWADTLADEWAKERGIDVNAKPPDWKRHGRAAGPIRNGEMLKNRPDLVVAFPGGKGTANRVKQATNAGIEIVLVGCNGP